MGDFPHLESNTKGSLGQYKIYRPARYLRNSQIFMIQGQIFMENDNKTHLYTSKFAFLFDVALNLKISFVVLPHRP